MVTARRSRYVKYWRVASRRGGFWRGLAVVLVRLGVAVEACCVQAGQGRARPGQAVEDRRVRARRGMARYGEAWRSGRAWRSR